MSEAASTAAGSASETPVASLSGAKRSAEKIDPVTALQEAIGKNCRFVETALFSSNSFFFIFSLDGLSLAMFEALRKLRDAVAPESGNLGNTNATDDTNNNTSTEPDVEELWTSYCKGDASVATKLKIEQPVKLREEFVKIYNKYEREKDQELVAELANAVLEKSDQITSAVDQVPGLHRTKAEQLAYIETLIEQNAKVSAELDEVYQTAQQRRNEWRQFIKQNTSRALGIEEE